MPFSGWSYKSTISVDNAAGAALTDYPVRVRLTAANFNFAHAKSDGTDVRFNDSDDSTELKHWIDTWDSGNSLATVWVKVPSISATSTKTIYLYYGNAGASDNSDGPNTFSYYNALSAAGDLTDLGSSFGTATWSVVSDAGSPTGNAVDASIGTANDAGRYKSLALPTAYAIECYVSDQGTTTASRAGPLLNMVSTGSWLRGGFGMVAGAKDAQVREDVAGSLTNRDSQAVSDTAGVNASAYYRTISIWKAKTVPTQGTTFTTAGEFADNHQGITTDGTNIWVASSNSFARYNMSGTAQDSGVQNPGGTSWGGLKYLAGDVYAVRFDDTTPATKIYKLTTPNTISGGVSLVATLTADFTPYSANGIENDGTYWLIGETSNNANGIRVIVYDASWNKIKSILVPIAGGAPRAGIQGMSLIGNRLYVGVENQRIVEFLWDNVNLELYLSNVFDSGITVTQGFCWDAANSRFYANDRNNTRVAFVTIAEDGTAKTASAHVRDATKSATVAFWSQATPASQADVGICAFRNARFAKMFVRKHAIPEPLASAGAESIAGNRRRRVMIASA